MPVVMPFVAVAALPVQLADEPETLIPQVPEAPEPVVDGTSSADCAVACDVPPVPPLATGRVPET